MSEVTGSRFSWLFVALAVSGAATLSFADLPVAVSSDHDSVHEYRQRGDIVSLETLLRKAELRAYRVLEAELEKEHGRLVYELELLDDNGRVSKRYFDATSGEPLGETEFD